MQKNTRSLERDIFELSALLTRERNGIRGGYFAKRSALHAYIAYFHRWNLVRLEHAFRAFGITADSFALEDGDCCMDIGSGPLTFVQAVWLNFPALREKKLTWYCIDRSKQILDAGEDLFLSLVAKTVRESVQESVRQDERLSDTDNDTENVIPWRIVKLTGDENTSVRNHCRLISCVNSLNEILLERRAVRRSEKTAFLRRFIERLFSAASPDAKLFFFEPGTPGAFENLNILRELVLAKGGKILAPCVHSGECCCAIGSPASEKSGKSRRWCHFTAPSESAPQELLDLTKKAHLEKERISFSLLFFGTNQAPHDTVSPDTVPYETDTLTCRIISEPFNLPHYGTAFYACSRVGLVLPVHPSCAALGSADIVHARYTASVRENPRRDKKSGGIILPAV